MTDTWGIPGPTFLACYLGALVATVVLASIHRRSLFRGQDGVRVDRLDAPQVAYLNGGDRLAIYSAIGGLRAADVIGIGAGRTLTQTGAIPAGVTSLDNAIYNAAARGVRARDLHTDHMVTSALDQLRDGLERSGLAVTRAQRREARIWVFVAGALAIVGVARLIAGVSNSRPVGYLIPCTIAAIVMTFLWYRGGNRWATTSAAREMLAWRLRNQHLSPRQSPAYTTYGAGGAALGVALFGAASLYSMDPAFAAEAEIHRAAVLGGGGVGGGSSSFSSFGGDSSCSAGSSCGGGGGCGGGGCGG
jgi:uncharacterized protein (TIGR04222 family)